MEEAIETTIFNKLKRLEIPSDVSLVELIIMVMENVEEFSFCLEAHHKEQITVNILDRFDSKPETVTPNDIISTVCKATKNGLSINRKKPSPFFACFRFR